MVYRVDANKRKVVIAVGILFRCVVLSLFLVVGFLGAPAQSAANKDEANSKVSTVVRSSSSDESVIVAHDDRYRMWSGSTVGRLEVTDNDEQDPYARVGVREIKHLSKGKNSLSIFNHGVMVNIPRSRKADVVAEYQLQDVDTGQVSNWATITIKVKHTKLLKVRQPKAGKLKLINRNSAKTRCHWNDPRGVTDGDDGRTFVAAKSSKVIRIHRKNLYLFCAIGPFGAITFNRILHNLR